MIEFAAGHPRLNFRVAGVCLHQGHALVQQMEGEAIWALPGGRPALCETSRDALVREMREETGVEVEVGRLLWVMEYFFAYEGTPIHELGFYYVMSLPDHPGVSATDRAFIEARRLPPDMQGDLELAISVYRDFKARGSS